MCIFRLNPVKYKYFARFRHILPFSLIGKYLHLCCKVYIFPVFMKYMIRCSHIKTFSNFAFLTSCYSSHCFTACFASHIHPLFSQEIHQLGAHHQKAVSSNSTKLAMMQFLPTPCSTWPELKLICELISRDH